MHKKGKIDMLLYEFKEWTDQKLGVALTCIYRQLWLKYTDCSLFTRKWQGVWSQQQPEWKVAMFSEMHSNCNKKITVL